MMKSNRLAGDVAIVTGAASGLDLSLIHIFTFTQTEIYKAASSASVLPVEYGVGSAQGDAQNEKIVQMCIRDSSISIPERIFILRGSVFMSWRDCFRRNLSGRPNRCF